MTSGYKLDVARLSAQYRARSNKDISDVEIKAIKEIVDWCSHAYLLGKNGREFAMPFDVPVMMNAQCNQAVVCLKCGKTAVGETSINEKVLHMICNHCDTCIDTDLAMDGEVSEYLS